MSADRATYLDSSAVVKLAVAEPESAALRRFLRTRQLVSSALAIAEVMRALLPAGAEALARGRAVLATLELARVNDRVLFLAGALVPDEIRSLDAIHLATARRLGGDLARLVTYDDGLAAAAKSLGIRVASPR